jgi:hypothetical protein
MFDFRKLQLGILDRSPLANCTNVNNTLTWLEGVASAVHKLLEEAYTIDLPHRSSPTDDRMPGSTGNL